MRIAVRGSAVRRDNEVSFLVWGDVGRVTRPGCCGVSLFLLGRLADLGLGVRVALVLELVAHVRYTWIGAARSAPDWATMVLKKRSFGAMQQESHRFMPHAQRESLLQTWL